MLRAQTSRGTDFWLTFLPNLAPDSTFVFVSSEVAAIATVSLPNAGWSTSISVPAGGLERVYVPSTYRVKTADTSHQYGVRVTANQLVSVYAISACNATTDASCIIPVASLPPATEYFAGDFKELNGNSGTSEVAVLAFEDSTFVQITPAAALISGRAATAAFTKMLNKGEVYMLTSKDNLSGTRIVCLSKKKKIAVFGGNACTSIRCTGACDHLYEQIPPINALGKQFVLTPFYKQQQGYVYRVVGIQNNTHIYVNSMLADSVDAGKYVTRDYKYDSSLCIQTDKPVLLLQFMTSLGCNGPLGGDPAMLVINPLEQTIKEAIVSTANTKIIKTHFLNILIPKTGLGSCKLDGSVIPKSKFTQIYCGDFYFYSDTTRPANHSISCPAGFISYVYGIGGYESYAYSAGSGYRNLNRFILTENYPSCDTGIIVKLSSQGDSATRFVWTFEDGSKDTSKFPVKYFAKAGVTNIALKYFLWESKTWDSTVTQITLKKSNVSTDLFPDSLNVCGPKYYDFKVPNAPVFTYKWSTGDTTSNLRVSAVGKYKLVMTNRITGCKITDSSYVSFYDDVIPEFRYFMASQCPKQPMYLYDSSKVTNDKITSYRWYVDYYLASSKKNDTIRSTSPNNYDIKLVLKTQNGCVDSVSKRILVTDIPRPVIGFTKWDSCHRGNMTVCKNGSYMFVGKISRYKWLFDDGDTQNTKQGMKHWKDTGLHWVRLIAYSETGCFDTSAKKYLRIYPAPKPAMAITDSMVCKSGNRFDVKNLTVQDAPAKEYIWDWGDGTGSTLKDPGSVSYSDTGTYNVIFSAGYVQTGCRDTVYRKVQVQQSPKAAIALDSSNYCLNRNYFAFRDASVVYGAKNHWVTWAWGDGKKTVDSLKVLKQYGSAGTFKVKMVMSTGKGCTDSTTKNVTVYSSPAARLGITDSNTCGTGNYFNFVNNSTAPVNARWNWNMGDNTVFTTKNIGKHSYGGPGNYLIVLSVLDPLTGCRDTARRMVKTMTAPDLRPRASDSIACFLADSLGFTDSSDYGSLVPQRKWYFSVNPKDTSSRPVLKWKFSSTGLHTITMVGGQVGVCADTQTLQIRVRYPDTPVSMGKIRRYACVNAVFDFQTSLIAGKSWTYAWNLGQAGSSALANPSGIIFGKPGKDTVELTLTDDRNCIFRVTDTLRVLPAPIVSITALQNDTQCFSGHAFVHRAVVNAASMPVTFAWTGTDGFGSAMQNPGKHTYPTPGQKSVKVWIRDSNGCIDSTTRLLRLEENPQVSLRDDSACEGVTRSIQPLLGPAGIGNLTYRWYINGSLSGAGPDLPYTFTPPGDHKIQLIVNTIAGCSDTSAMVLRRVFPNPVAAFGYVTYKTTALGIRVDLNDSSTGAASWMWRPEPGKTLSGKNVQFLYRHPGNVSPWLIATNRHGCADSTMRTIFLKSEEDGFVPSGFSPNGDGRNDVFKPEFLSAVTAYEMVIFDRWGGKVFETRDPMQGWDGTFKGENVQEGAYAYRINLIFFTGKRQVVSGSVTLLR
ncbi:MAG: gliding motility-associated C-terminal domain-containing protein [Bacteroidetes bacterium]|nr:gliding motility-associated C-terminal domain-containing protein [Bacteroidota bacterium]